MCYDLCVTHWLIAKKNKRNKQMLKEEDVLIVIRSEAKFYLMLKPTDKCSVRLLQDKVASALHWTIPGRRQEGTSVYAQPPAQVAHTPSVLRWFA